MSEEERNNCNKYILTKFFRAVVSIRKQDQGAGKEVYCFAPLLDFSSNSAIDWSKSLSEIDKQLYKRYGLLESEIQFVEKMVKSMD